MAFNATTCDRVLELDLRMSQMGPPISIMIDGKQYIAVSGGPAAGGGGGGGANAGTPRPAHLVMLALDGTAPIPGAPLN